MVKLLPYLEYMQVQPLLRPPECFLLFWYKNVRGYTLYRRARIPPWHLDLPAAARICHHTGGYLFYSRGLRGIIDALLGAMSVHIKVSWCVDAFVCVCQMLCFCRSLWTSHHLVTLNVHSQHPLTAQSMSSHSCTHYMSTHRTHTGHTQDTLIAHSAPTHYGHTHGHTHGAQ
jgi:hypothetical protein